MTTEELNKIDKCRRLLPEPAPEVVGKLVEALEWALAKEPSPCRCMGFATPPHVCKAHAAIQRATGRKMEVCQTCNGYGFLAKISETCGDCVGRGLRWANDKDQATAK